MVVQEHLQMLLAPGMAVAGVVAQVDHLAKVEMVVLELAQTLLQTSLVAVVAEAEADQMEAMLRRD
jgi:hypothetical protein